MPPTVETIAHTRRGHPPASWAFRWLTGFFLALCVGLLALALLHKSSSPDVLGRYGAGYAAVLAVLAGLAGYFFLLLRRPYGKLAEWSMNAYVVVIATVVALLVAEFGLRAFAPWGIDFFHWLPYHMQGMVSDPDLGYRHPPSTSYRLGAVSVALNSHGLRDDEIPYARPPSERRILALGDSVTFGWGVDQGTTFADRMEPLLRKRTGERWQVINSGVNGYNSEQEAAFLESHGWRYDPEIVVLVFVDNDVDARLAPNEATWRRSPQWPASLPEAFDRLRQLSYLNQLTQVMARLQPVEGKGPRASITQHARWPESRAALQRIATSCKIRGAPFLIAHLGGDDAAFFAEMARNGIATVSLGPAWERVAPELRRVSRVDPHPAALVHAAFADVLVEEMGRRGWLEARASQVPVGAR